MQRTKRIENRIELAIEHKLSKLGRCSVMRHDTLYDVYSVAFICDNGQRFKFMYALNRKNGKRDEYITDFQNNLKAYFLNYYLQFGVRLVPDTGL